MRALLPVKIVASAAILLPACSSPTGPSLPPSDDPGISVLTVAPSFAMIEGQRFVKLTAILSGAEAREVHQSQIVWTSSDTNVATVRDGGLVEGRKAGRVLISARWKTANGSATVVVLNQVAKKPGSPDSPCMKRRATSLHLSIPQC